MNPPALDLALKYDPSLWHCNIILLERTRNVASGHLLVIEMTNLHTLLLVILTILSYIRGEKLLKNTIDFENLTKKYVSLSNATENKPIFIL